MLAPELEDLGHISPARIVVRVQHTDCVEQGRLGVRSERDVVELRSSSQVLALAARRHLVGDELVAVERAALVVKKQAVWGMLRGQQEDRTEVSKALAIGNMAVDVMGAGMQRLERHKGWTWGRCSELRVLKGGTVDVVVTSEWEAEAPLCCLRFAVNLEEISDQTWSAQLVLTNLTSMAEEDHPRTLERG